MSDHYDNTDDDEAAGAREEWDYLFSGGVHAARGNKGEAGIRSHRGVLHPDEYVDTEELRSAVEAELGFSYDEARAVYRQGRMTEAQLELRARIDARLLELAEAGGNMLALARCLGWRINGGRSGEGGASCRTMERALKRARARASASRLNALLERLSALREK
jgi:hypothetical protein